MYEDSAFEYEVCCIAEVLEAWFRRFRKIAKVTIMFAVSVRPSTRNSSDPDGGILMKIDISIFFENL
jgi:hypothetical protein